MSILNEVLQAVLEAALPILAVALVSWVSGKAVELFRRLKDKNAELYEILRAVSERAVKAAEQIYGSKTGRDKKAYALDVAEKYLSAKGINLDLDVIDAYIEAAVADMNAQIMPTTESAAEQ